MTDSADSVAFCSVCKTNIASSSGKLLKCLHFSCLGCFSSKAQDNVFKCGSCDTENKVDECSKNVLLSDETRCSLCSDNLTANYKCVQCEDMMCSQCALAHKRVKLTKDHVLTQEFILEEMCELHKSLPLQWYCRTCLKKSCSQCQLTCHVGHQHQPLKEYKIEQINQSVAKIKDLKDSVKNYKTGIQADDDSSEPYSVKDALKTEVDKFAERLKSYIDENLEFHEILEKCTKNKKIIDESCQQVCLISFIANSITNSDVVICKAVDPIQQLVKAFKQDCSEYDLKLSAAEKNFISNLNVKEFIASLRAKIRNAFMTPTLEHRTALGAGTESNIIPLVNDDSLNFEMAENSSENECQIEPNIKKSIPNVKIRLPFNGNRPLDNFTFESAIVPSLMHGVSNMQTISCHGLSGIPDSPVARVRNYSGSKKRKKGLHNESTFNEDPADDLICLENNGILIHADRAEIISDLNRPEKLCAQNGSLENILSETRRPFSQQLGNSDNENGQKRRKLIEPIILQKCNSINLKGVGERQQVNLSACDQYSETSTSSREEQLETDALRRSAVVVPEVGHSSPSTWASRDWEVLCSVCGNDTGKLLKCKGTSCSRVFHSGDHVPSFSEDYIDDDPVNPFVCGFCQDPLAYKISEDNVPKEKRKVSKMTLFEKKAAERILLELYCHADSVHFHNSFPPIDFSIIREKLSGVRMRGDDFGGLHRERQRSPNVKSYHKIEEFIIDLNELFRNCFAIFKDDSAEVFKAGKAVAKLYQELMEKYLVPYVRLVDIGTGERLLRKRPNSRSRGEAPPFHADRIEENIIE